MNATVANHRRRIWQFMFDESLSLDSTISRGRYGIDQFASPFHHATDSATKRTEVKDCKGSGAARGTTPPAYLSFHTARIAQRSLLTDSRAVGDNARDTHTMVRAKMSM